MKQIIIEACKQAFASGHQGYYHGGEHMLHSMSYWVVTNSGRIALDMLDIKKKAGLNRIPQIQVLSRLLSGVEIKDCKNLTKLVVDILIASRK